MGRSKRVVKAKRYGNGSRKIQAIYDANGGTRNSARICGYSAELLSHWKRDGRIPLRKVAEISIKLKCDPLDLNTEEVKSLIRSLKSVTII